MDSLLEEKLTEVSVQRLLSQMEHGVPLTVLQLNLMSVVFLVLRIIAQVNGFTSMSLNHVTRCSSGQIGKMRKILVSIMVLILLPYIVTPKMTLSFVSQII